MAEPGFAQGKAEAIQLDLMDLQSVRDCADKIETLVQHIDFLILNAGSKGLSLRPSSIWSQTHHYRPLSHAGVMGGPLKHTKQGFESQIGTNHMGHALLTQRLLKLLQLQVVAYSELSNMHVFTLVGLPALQHILLTSNA